MLSERSPISVGLVALIAGWLVAALMAYAAFDSRVSVIESQYNLLRQDVSEVKGDVKQLLRQTR